MFKRNMLFALSCFLLMILGFYGFANATDITIELSMTDATSDIGSVGDMNGKFSQHFEYGNLLLNGRTIGHYRITGIGYEPPYTDSQNRNGDIYIEIKGMGYIFLKIMASSSSPMDFEGIILGGTGSFVGYQGTVSGKIPEDIDVPVTITFHLQ